MATVKKLDKNKWEVRYDSYDTSGKRHQRRKSFSRAADARAFAASLDSSTPYEASFMTFDRWADEWFEVQRPKLEGETARLYLYTLTRCKEYLGRMRLTDITPSRLEAFFNELGATISAKTGQPLSTGTLKVYRAVLSRIFRRAVRDGYIPSNPLDRVDPPGSTQRELVLPDLEALKSRMEALKGKPMYLPVCLALFTGMRRGEVCGLRWDCVDLDHRLLHVRRVRIAVQGKTIGRNDIPLNIAGLHNNISRDYTKTKRQRTMSLPQTLVDILRAQRIAQAEAQLRLGTSYIKTDYVCTNTNGLPVSPATVSKALRGLCRFHDLRHLNASLLLDEGYSVAAVADRIGHASPATTLNVYAHAIKERDHQAADSIDRRIQLKV